MEEAKSNTKKKLKIPENLGDDIIAETSKDKDTYDNESDQSVSI